MDTILAYVPSLNRFIDGNDMIVHDISSLFDNWQIQKWINYGAKDIIMQAKTGEMVLLVELVPEEEDQLYDYLGFQESFGMQTDRTYY